MLGGGSWGCEVADQTQADATAAARSPEHLTNALLESFVHHYNQMGGMIRGASAKSMGLTNPENYAAPYPGSNSVTVKAGIGAPGIAAIICAILLAGLSGFVLLGQLRPLSTQPTPTAVAPPVTPAPYDPSRYQFKIVPDEE